jgi:hypothetical protein
MPKHRVINSIDDLKRNELIHIIRVYDNYNIIKGYHTMNKTQLKEAINKHIILSPDFKTIKPKQHETKLIEYDEFKKKLQNKKDDEILTGKQERKLHRARGRQIGTIEKLKDELKGLKEEMESDYKLKNDENFKKEYNDVVKALNTEREKLKTITQLIVKHNKLVEKIEEKKEKEKK